MATASTFFLMKCTVKLCYNAMKETAYSVFYNQVLFASGSIMLRLMVSNLLVSQNS
jgi:hypothetical protein